MEMTFQNLGSVAETLTAAFAAQFPLAALSLGAQERMRYPKLLPLMRFRARRYAAAGFGNLFVMETRGMGGLMQLATLVFTPNCGTSVPLLLIDVMAMGKKRAAFVEYYDLTAQGADCPALAAVAARYAGLPDYPETPAWYVRERAPYSLIKGGADDQALLAMLADAAQAYAETCGQRTVPSAENLPGIARFVARMATEGNPSSAAMTRVLGREGAERFFRTAIMPAQFQEND